jgi:SP family sugar:H+ symporter-like MFS transporter
LVVSAAMQTGALMIMGALGSVHDQHPTVQRGIVGMLLVYSFAWSVGWAPLTYVISTELPSASQRENTLRVAYTVKLVME